MNILYLLSDGANSSPVEWIEALAEDHQVEVIDLAAKTVAYDVLVDKIFAGDKVISWGRGTPVDGLQPAAAS